MYAIIGLILIGIAEFCRQGCCFSKTGAALSNVDNARKLIVNLTNFISGFGYIIGNYVHLRRLSLCDGIWKRG